ncbi:MAG: AgmX/PglI C-terminal domain-containing protein [Spirochaetia bacterium]|nr:AgmX/PglI C-terminal domain-containing protein [Spirochaetia bacterium]
MKNQLLYIIIAFMAVALGFMIYKFNRLENIQAGMARQNVAVDKDGKIVDPYAENQVKNTVVKNYGDAQTCFNEFLKTNPEQTDGKIKIDWQIDEDGQVINPQLVSFDFKSEALSNCLINKMKAWRFPAPPFEKPYYAFHTFRFKKGE